MKKIFLLMLVFLTGCASSMKKEAVNEVYEDVSKVTLAIDEAEKKNFKNYLFIDLRENINENEYIKGFTVIDKEDLDKTLKGLKSYTFIMLISDRPEFTLERASYLENKGFTNVKSINIITETLIESLRELGYLQSESCPPGGC
ncbi:MAG: hypothetical protein GX931_01345 [Acholeplasmataceae bacterium]|nr:hypothetical protein [Acholeplasmataceae bacterium]